MKILEYYFVEMVVDIKIRFLSIDTLIKTTVTINVEFFSCNYFQ